MEVQWVHFQPTPTYVNMILSPTYANVAKTDCGAPLYGNGEQPEFDRNDNKKMEVQWVHFQPTTTYVNVILSPTYANVAKTDCRAPLYGNGEQPEFDRNDNKKVKVQWVHFQPTPT